MCPLLGTWPATQACALTGNGTATLWFTGWHSTTKPHQPGQENIFEGTNCDSSRLPNLTSHGKIYTAQAKRNFWNDKNVLDLGCPMWWVRFVSAIIRRPSLTSILWLTYHILVSLVFHCFKVFYSNFLDHPILLNLHFSTISLRSLVLNSWNLNCWWKLKCYLRILYFNGN